MGDWKGLRRNLHKQVSALELYDLKNDVSESRNVAAQHPTIVKRIEAIMTREHQPSALFPLRALESDKKLVTDVTRSR